MKKFLIIDDSPVSSELIEEWILETYGVKPLLAYNTSEALSLLDSYLPDLVICDYEMPNGNGEIVLNYLKINNVLSPLIFFTGRYDLIWDLEYPLIGFVNDKDYSKLFKLISEHFKI